MFGSDWPVCLLAAPYPDVVQTAGTLTTARTLTEHNAILQHHRHLHRQPLAHFNPERKH